MTIQTQRCRLVMRVMPVTLVAFVALPLVIGSVPACERAHGQETAGAQDASPDASPDTPPNRMLEFAALYRTNCSGCHGPDGGGGAALALADPIYLTIAGDAIVRRAIANGVRGTAMPAFSREAGGTLTDAQIDAIVWGIRRWANHPASTSPASPSSAASAAIDAPPYADDEPGDAQRGAAVFETWCSRCHGAGGGGGPKASSIVDPAYLALVSDQGLRTTVIAGRRELGAPDWRGNLPGRAMTSREIADVVAWLAAQRSRSNDSASQSRSASGSQP